MGRIQAFDPAKAPMAFSMTFTPRMVENAKPMTIQFLRAIDNGEACYVGTAVNQWGDHMGGGCIIIRQNLRTIGGRAFSHILTGGDRRTKLSRERFAAEQQRFAVEVWHALLHLQELEAQDEEAALVAVLRAAFNFNVDVERGEMTEEDLETMTLLGAPLWAVESLSNLGYRPIINPRDVAKRYARSHATTTVHGEWDDLATSIAYSHTVPFGVVCWLKQRGVRYSLTNHRQAG